VGRVFGRSRRWEFTGSCSKSRPPRPATRVTSHGPTRFFIRPFPACLSPCIGTNTRAVDNVERLASARVLQSSMARHTDVNVVNRAQLWSIQPHDSATMFPIHVSSFHSSGTITIRAVRIAADGGCGNWCIRALLVRHAYLCQFRTLRPMTVSVRSLDPLGLVTTLPRHLRREMRSLPHV